MKPDWDKLMVEYEGSDVAGVYDVDCTKAGESLCRKAGVRGYPTIMYGDPADVQQLEKYKGPRTFDGLLKFAKDNLHGPKFLKQKAVPETRGKGKVNGVSEKKSWGQKKPFASDKKKPFASEKKKKTWGGFGKPSSLFKSHDEEKKRVAQSVKDHHRRMEDDRRKKERMAREHHDKQRQMKQQRAKVGPRSQEL